MIWYGESWESGSVDGGDLGSLVFEGVELRHVRR